jgi:hypothetical protein
MPPTTNRNEIAQLGVILCEDIAKEAIAALKYLVVQLNTLQSTFEYQILPTTEDCLLKTLASGRKLERNVILTDLARFSREYSANLNREIAEYRITASGPDHYILISRATFKDEFYMTGGHNISILALGNWERFMAPPSLVEFILSMVLSSSLYALPSIQGLTHYGTKGCLFDFNADLSNARFMSLQGYICTECREKLLGFGYPELADELQVILGKQWLGKIADPHSPAAIASKLGYNLFVTKGLVPRWWERWLGAIEQEGIKELIKLIAAVLLAASLFYLGFKK